MTQPTRWTSSNPQGLSKSLSEFECSSLLNLGLGLYWGKWIHYLFCPCEQLFFSLSQCVGHFDISVLFWGLTPPNFAPDRFFSYLIKPRVFGRGRLAFVKFAFTPVTLRLMSATPGRRNISPTGKYRWLRLSYLRFVVERLQTVSFGELPPKLTTNSLITADSISNLRAWNVFSVSFFVH
jgi:hypothetical protein